MVWQKTPRMATNHRRTWRRHGWRSRQAQASSTRGGTVYEGAAQHNCGHQGRETKLPSLLEVWNHP